MYDIKRTFAAENRTNIITIMANEKKFRVEADLLGELQVPADALYGVQTQPWYQQLSYLSQDNARLSRLHHR